MDVGGTQIMKWNKKDAKAQMFVVQWILQKILGKLVGALMATIWLKLESLHLKKKP
jgi:hypothetical protein